MKFSHRVLAVTLLLTASTTIESAEPAADPAPTVKLPAKVASPDSQKAINTALGKLSKWAKPDPTVEFLPMAFVRRVQPKVSVGWHEHQAIMPGTEVEVDLLNRVRKDFERDLSPMVKHGFVDAWFYFYQRDGQIHLILRESDGSELRLVAKRPRNLEELRNIEYENFKPE